MTATAHPRPPTGGTKTACLYRLNPARSPATRTPPTVLTRTSAAWFVTSSRTFISAGWGVAPSARFQRRLFFQTFPRTSRSDSGEYYCEAANKAGPVQRCRAARMEVRKCCSEPPSKVNRRVFSGPDETRLTSPPCFFKVT